MRGYKIEDQTRNPQMNAFVIVDHSLTKNLITTLCYCGSLSS